MLSAAPNLPSLYNGHFFSKKQGCICKHFVNKLPPPAVRRCNSFCFYGIAAAIGLRHTNGNIGVTISNIRPECFSFSLPLLQFQKRFLARFSENCFAGRKKNGLHCKPFIKKQRTKLLVPVAFGSAICYTNGVYTTAERK